MTPKSPRMSMNPSLLRKKRNRKVNRSLPLPREKKKERKR